MKWSALRTSGVPVWRRSSLEASAQVHSSGDDGRCRKPCTRTVEAATLLVNSVTESQGPFILPMARVLMPTAKSPACPLPFSPAVRFSRRVVRYWDAERFRAVFQSKSVEHLDRNSGRLPESRISGRILQRQPRRPMHPDEPRRLAIPSRYGTLPRSPACPRLSAAQLE